MRRWDGEIPEFRRKQALAYPLAGMLALMAMAVFSGVTKGYDDLADYAATLSQGQVRALSFHLDPHAKRVRCPKGSSFAYVLTQFDAEPLEQVLLLWQEQVLGPVRDRLFILDGKEIRHADVESVSAVSGSSRWQKRRFEILSNFSLICASLPENLLHPERQRFRQEIGFSIVKICNLSVRI